MLPAPSTSACTLPATEAWPARARWPSPAAILQARGVDRWADSAKAWWRHAWAARHHPVLLAVLDRHPAWRRLFEADPRYAHCALSHFVDRRFGMGERFASMAADLQAAAHWFGASLVSRLVQREQVSLWSLDEDTHLHLGLNDVSYHEGLWALSLRDASGRRLYYLSFSFLGARTLLIPTVQGPIGPDESARDLIRRLTKSAHGMRPPVLLIAALRLLAAQWGCAQLLGIAPEHHVKGRWNLRGRRLRFDYATLWQEQGGQPDRGGHWALPLPLGCRELHEVPSHKRAMYRRRLAMLETMRHRIEGFFAESRHRA